jgi:WD40 repeat protein
VLHDGDESVNRVAFSPDGSRVAAGTSRLLILDVVRGGVVARLRPHQDAIWSLEFSKDGMRLATCSWDGTVRILESVPLRERTERGSD